jgi:hypothetical protein
VKNRELMGIKGGWSMGKMMTVDIMRQLLKEWNLPDQMEITWNVNNEQKVTCAEKKFHEYLADGWLAYSEDPKEGRKLIYNFDPKIEMIILLPPLGGG